MSVSDHSPQLSREPRGPVFETPRVELCELSEHTTVITLSGEHDLFTKYRLLEALARARQAPNLIIDLTPSVFVDSSIVGALLGACRSQPDDEQRVEFVLPDNGNQVNRTLDLMGVRALLRIHPSLGHALQRAGEHDATRTPPRWPDTHRHESSAHHHAQRSSRSLRRPRDLRRRMLLRLARRRSRRRRRHAVLVATGRATATTSATARPRTTTTGKARNAFATAHLGPRRHPAARPRARSPSTGLGRDAREVGSAFLGQCP